MVAGDSPDWLPAGWKVEVKVKNGRKIKYYSNKETGKKLYSKNDIIRYVEMGQSCSSKPQPESQHNKMSSKNNIMPLAMEINETPEWLPHGWIMELKTRKSGGKYKCYIDPLTGSKFYSKPQVSEYLRTVQGKSCKYQKKKMIVDSVSNPSMETGGETLLKPEESQDLKTLKGTTCTSNQKHKGFSRHSVKEVVIKRVVPDGLPPGQAKEVKIEEMKNCIRKDWYYSNKETGKKLYSKNDIIRYVEMGQSCSSKPQPESQHNKMSSKNNIMPLAMEINETPEWLPHGWIMELKTRKSGGKYKCYIDPLTGSKFYSKPQVSEYLRTVQGKSCKYQKKKMIVDSVSNPSMETGGETLLKPEESQDLKTLKGTTCTSNQKHKGFSRQSVKEVVIKRVVPDGLPPGQAKEVKIEEMKNCIRKDWPSMVELAGGETSLKPEEVQDMKSLKGSTSKQKQKDFTKQSVKKVVIERVTPSGLPPGWTKEIKFEKKGNRTRQDPYYTDPVSGYVFRSQKDALRYLETGDINRCAIKPRKRDELRFLNEEASLPPAAEMMNFGHHATRRGLFAGTEEDSVISSLETTDTDGSQKRHRVSLSADALITTTLTTEILERKSPFDNVTNECAKTEENTDPTSSHKRQCISLSADAVNNSNPPAKVLEGKPSLDNMIEVCAKTKERDDTTCSPPPVTEGSERTQFKGVCSENGTISALASGMVRGEKLTENDVGKSSNRKMQINSSKSKKSKATDLPRRSSKRISGLKPEMEINVSLSERDLKAAARKSGVREPKPPLGDLDNLSHGAPRPLETSSMIKIAHNAFTDAEAPADVEQSNRGKNPLEDQAVPEDQPAAQETEKNEESMDPELLYPFADTWSDPCLEFAFKTLTGAIPIEDNSEIPACLFEQQFDTSHTQGDGCLGFQDFGLSNIFQNDITSDFDAPPGEPTPAPGLFQTDVSSNFDDALGKPVSAPQLPENPAFLPSGNASLPTCGGNTPQHPSSGGGK